MTHSASEYDEFGLKVQRAQHKLQQVRGVGTVAGITVEVDSENRLVALDHPDAESILAAYDAAVRDKQPRVEAATREVLGDPHAQAITALVKAIDARLEQQRRRAEEDEQRFWQRRQEDPLGRRRRRT